MNQEDILKMARQAGLINSYEGRECPSDLLLACFAALVAAKAAQDERAACDKAVRSVVEDLGRIDACAAQIYGAALAHEAILDRGR